MSPDPSIVLFGPGTLTLVKRFSDARDTASGCDPGEWPSALDADEGPQARHALGEAGMFSDHDDRCHVLVGARRLFRHAALRGAADKDAPRCEIVDHLPPAPFFQRRVARHGAARPVAGGGKCFLLALRGAGEDV